MIKKTPDYLEILRLHPESEYSQQEITDSVGSSKRTVNKTLKLAQEHHIHWPLPPGQTNDELTKLLTNPPQNTQSDRQMPKFDLIHKQLLRNSVNNKLLQLTSSICWHV